MNQEAREFVPLKDYLDAWYAKLLEKSRKVALEDLQKDARKFDEIYDMGDLRQKTIPF